MKKALLIVFGLILLGSVFLLIQAPSDSENNGELDQAVPATLITLSDDVFHLSVVGERVIRTETLIMRGDGVRTSETGRAVIESEHITTLDAESEITYEPAERSKYRLLLISGRVWSQVAKVFDKGEYYEIETNTARASVRGTSFGVAIASENETVIHVTEGAVVVEARSDGAKRTVEAGFKATVRKDGTIVVLPFSDDDYDEWLLSNNPNLERPEPPGRDQGAVEDSAVSNESDSQGEEEGADVSGAGEGPSAEELRQAELQQANTIEQEVLDETDQESNSRVQ